jgi:hypothetical protein
LLNVLRSAKLFVALGFGEAGMSPESRLAGQLERALFGLAAAAGGVVAVMEDAGVRGTMGSDDLCPVALWLAAHLDAEVHVGCGRARAREHRVWVEAMLPAGVGDFVTGFDTGSYPQLVSPFLPDAGYED